MEWKWWLRHRLLKPHLLWRDFWWWFLHRTFYRHDIVKLRSLKPGYYDKDFRMLHACFQLLVDYVEEEKPFDFINWESDEGHRHAASEIKALYHWWKEVYLKRADADSGDEEMRRYLEEEENLVRLMKVRTYLWT